MAEYDGWALKSGNWLRPGFVCYTRKDIITKFEKIMGKGSWGKYRRRGFHKIVKVKIIEVK